ncbi:quinone oxidoreductase family protein [Streptosporangium sandarakinum]
MIRSRPRQDEADAVRVPGMEVAGVITEIGPAVDRAFTMGDAVMAIVVPSGEHGGYRADLVVPARSVAKIPAGLSDVQAATIPMNGLTAQLALDTLALPAGATVAVTGAAGSVGGYFVQLAKQAGLVVVADAARQDESFVRDCGADEVVPRGDDFVAKIRRHHPGGVGGRRVSAGDRRGRLRDLRDLPAEVAALQPAPGEPVVVRPQPVAPLGVGEAREPRGGVLVLGQRPAGQRPAGQPRDHDVAVPLGGGAGAARGQALDELGGRLVGEPAGQVVHVDRHRARRQRRVLAPRALLQPGELPGRPGQPGGDPDERRAQLRQPVAHPRVHADHDRPLLAAVDHPLRGDRPRLVEQPGHPGRRGEHGEQRAGQRERLTRHDRGPAEQQHRADAQQPERLVGERRRAQPLEGVVRLARGRGEPVGPGPAPGEPGEQAVAAEPGDHRGDRPGQQPPGHPADGDVQRQPGHPHEQAAGRQPSGLLAEDRPDGEHQRRRGERHGRHRRHRQRRAHRAPGGRQPSAALTPPAHRHPGGERRRHRPGQAERADHGDHGVLPGSHAGYEDAPRRGQPQHEQDGGSHQRALLEFFA